MMNNNWTREESILALAMYFELPFGCLHKANKKIIELANFIKRTPSSVSMKLCNFARFDTELAKRGISGLKNGSRLDEKIWNEFFQNTEALLEEVEKINGAIDIILTNRDAEIGIPQGAEGVALTKFRRGQTFFRNTVLSAYNYTCCITGIDLPKLLQASHIKAWKDSDPTTERNNPSNGLCLNYLHHKAFDSGYITIDEDYKIVISKQIKEHLTKDIFKELFQKFEGALIKLPHRFLPDKTLIRYHNTHVFDK